MTDRVKELEAQLIAKDKQLQEALENLHNLQKREAEEREIVSDLIAKIVHDINNMSSRIRSSGQMISRAFSELRRHLPTLLFQLPSEQQKLFLALIDRCEQNQRQSTERLSTREERYLRRALKKELEAYELDDVDELADTLVDMGIYKDISPFIPLLRGEHQEKVLQAASSLITLWEVNHWNLTPSCNRIVQITHFLKDSLFAFLNNQLIEGKITEGIERVLALYQPLLEHRQIEVIKQYAEVPLIPYYPGLNLVWMNLLENAMEAIESHGTIEITTSQQDRDLVIQITDSGCGISEEMREHVFERSVTTKSRGTVHGVGLYIVYKMINKHQGKIEVESQPGSTTFRIWLPIIR